MIGQCVPDVKCIGHLEHTTAVFVNVVYAEWTTIVHGLTTVLENGTRSISYSS